MRFSLQIAGIVLCELIYLTAAHSPEEADEALSSLLRDMWHWSTQESPEFATKVGLNDNTAGRLDSWTELRFLQRKNFCQKMQDQSSTISKDDLTFANRINLSVFKNILKNCIDNFKYIGFFHPITSLEGPQILLKHLVSKLMTLGSYNDFQKLLSRYGEFPRQADELLDILKKNVETGIMPHHLVMKGILEQFDSLIVPVVKSPFFKPFLQIPLSFPPEQRRTLRQQAQERISQDLLPSFEKLRQYLNSTYLQHTRPDPGINFVMNGGDYYDSSLEFYTATKLSSQEIQSIGLAEVKRLRKKLLLLAVDCGYAPTASVAHIMEDLRSSERHFFPSKDSLMEAMRITIFNRIKPNLPPLFQNFAIDNLTILEDNSDGIRREEGVWYEPPSLDGSRPGVIYLNTNDLTFIRRHEVTSLSLHMCYPGRHYQNLYLQLQPSVAMLRKASQNLNWNLGPSQLQPSPAFVDGWALYSEFLGQEMGFYEDPFKQLARSTRELGFAARMVVDTGVHSLGWSLQEAKKFMLDHTPFNKDTIEIELTKILAWPGKACSYKVGEIKIRELRQRAENALGKMFDSLNFHQTILKCSSSWSMVQECVSKYIIDNIHHPNENNSNAKPEESNESNKNTNCKDLTEASSAAIVSLLRITYISLFLLIYKMM